MAAPGPELLGGRNMPPAAHDERMHGLTPSFIGDSKCANLCDGVVGREDVLNLHRIHIVAAGYDHELLPVHEV